MGMGMQREHSMMRVKRGSKQHMRGTGCTATQFQKKRNEEKERKRNKEIHAPTTQTTA